MLVHVGLVKAESKVTKWTLTLLFSIFSRVSACQLTSIRWSGTTERVIDQQDRRSCESFPPQPRYPHAFTLGFRLENSTPVLRWSDRAWICFVTRVFLCVLKQPVSLGHGATIPVSCSRLQTSIWVNNGGELLPLNPHASSFYVTYLGSVTWGHLPCHSWALDPKPDNSTWEWLFIWSFHFSGDIDTQMCLPVGVSCLHPTPTNRYMGAED